MSRLHLTAALASLAFACATFAAPCANAGGFIFLHAESAGLSLKTETGVAGHGSTFSAGFRGITARSQDWQLSVGMAVRTIDTSSVNVKMRNVTMLDFLNVGAHWFPRQPLFWLGPVALRPLAGIDGGMSFGSAGFDVPINADAGFAFSGEAPAGLFVEGWARIDPERLTYQDDAFNSHYVDASPYVGFRGGFFF